MYIIMYFSGKAAHVFPERFTQTPSLRDQFIEYIPLAADCGRQREEIIRGGQSRANSVETSPEHISKLTRNLVEFRDSFDISSFEEFRCSSSRGGTRVSKSKLIRNSLRWPRIEPRIDSQVGRVSGQSKLGIDSVSKLA